MTTMKHKASTAEVEALRRFTHEQITALRDIVRILRLLRAQRIALQHEVFREEQR
jgi:hypothetical protein